MKNPVRNAGKERSHPKFDLFQTEVKHLKKKQKPKKMEPTWKILQTGLDEAISMLFPFQMASSRR